MDISWLELGLSLGIGVGLAAAAGLRVFLPLLMLGIAGRLDLLQVTGGFEWLASTAAIVALAIATIFEISAYYVPVLDNFLDAIAGPLAVMAGVVSTASVLVDLPPAARWSIAIVAGGGTAGIVQTVTTVARLKSTAFTAGFGNFALATLELAGSFLASLVAILAPFIALLGVVFVIALVLLARRMFFRPSPRRA